MTPKEIKDTVERLRDKMNLICAYSHIGFAMFDESIKYSLQIRSESKEANILFDMLIEALEKK